MEETRREGTKFVQCVKPKQGKRRKERNPVDPQRMHMRLMSSINFWEGKGKRPKQAETCRLVSHCMLYTREGADECTRYMCERQRHVVLLMVERSAGGGCLRSGMDKPSPAILTKPGDRLVLMSSYSTRDCVSLYEWINQPSIPNQAWKHHQS